VYLPNHVVKGPKYIYQITLLKDRSVFTTSRCSWSHSRLRLYLVSSFNLWSWWPIYTKLGDSLCHWLTLQRPTFFFLHWISGPGREADHHTHIVSSWRMSGAMPQLPSIPLWLKQGELYVTLNDNIGADVRTCEVWTWLAPITFRWRNDGSWYIPARCETFVKAIMLL